MLQTLPRSKTASDTAYMDRGHGAETLVLIHGVGMRIEAWAPQINALSRHYRVIAFDLPGHGQTPALTRGEGLPAFVEWFANAVEELQLEAISVAGHSMGALIATGYAATSPKRLRRVALLNGVHQRSLDARRAVEARADEILTGEFDREAPLDRWFSIEERTGEAFGRVRSMLQMVDTPGYAAAYKAFATGDSIYAACWPQVTCPALFLTSDEDRNSTPEMAEDMARATPNGRAVVIKGHRHMVNLTAPEEVNEVMADWLTWQPG